ncbi:hypothetical protein Tco_0837377 [Tanacetum coccineum]
MEWANEEATHGGAIKKHVYITASNKTKLDLELVPKENILDIGKCNGRIPRRLTPKEPTFQVVLDAIALTSCYPAFLITADVPEEYMHQFWNSVYKHDTFYRFKINKKKRFKLTLEVFRYIFQICPRVPGRDFDALLSEEDTVSFLRELSHTGEINSLNDVVVNHFVSPELKSFGGMFHHKNVDYVELLWEDFIYQIENRVYKKQEKMYYPRFTKVIIHHFLIQEKTLSWGNKIRMHTSKDDYLINSLRFVSAKESTQIYGAILPECLTSPAMKNLSRKAKLKPLSVDKITPTVTSEGTGDKPRVPDVTKDDFTESESESWGNDEDDSNNDDQDSSNEDSEQENESEEQVSNSEQEEEYEDDDQEEEEFIHTPSPTDDKDDENLESESNEVIKSDEEKGLDDTDYQFDDDVDARLEEPTQTDIEVVQGECADAEMIDAQQGNENLETTQEHVVEDAHVTISTVTKKTEVPATSSSRSSDLASKFLKFSDIPHTNAEIVSPLDIHVHHEVPRTGTHSSYNTEVAELKKDPLHTQVTSLVDDHLDTRLGERNHESVNFALLWIKKLIKNHVRFTLAKVSSQLHSTYEAASTLMRPRVKERKTSKDAEPTTGPKYKDSTSGSSKDTKSQPKPSRKSVQSEEPVFEVADSGMPQDQEGNLGDNEDLNKERDCPSRSDWFKKPTPPQEPTDPYWHVGKTTQEGPPQKWLMTLAASTSTDKSLKDFDELMSTPIEFSRYILNGLKIKN